MHTNALFVSSNESNSGSIIITMGLMQLLKSKIEKVGFFRPIIETKAQDNPDIRFMLEYFTIEQEYEESYGIKKDEFETLMVTGKLNEAVGKIITNLQKLKEKNNFVLIEGIAKSAFSQSIGFDINLELAKNLNTDFISIINAKNKTTEAILNEIKIESEAIKQQGVREVMIVVNRVSMNDIALLKTQNEPNSSVYFTPEVEELDCITINEVKKHLQCDIVFGQEKDLNRLIRSKLVAAMTIEHYLERVTEKSLIIVPSDRCDIIASTILALYSKGFPNVSGILLTGNLPLPKAIKNLLNGLSSFTLPILTTSLDTYQAATKIEAIKAKISSTSERKIALGMGLFFDNIDTNPLLSKLNTPTEAIMTPVMFEYTLFEKARANKRTIVLPESEDERILRAAEIILHRGIANIILLGNPQEISHHAGILGLDISKATIIDPDTSPLLETFTDAFYQMRRHKGLQYHTAQDAMVHGTYFGTMLVQQGLADGMVSGATHTTADTIRPALQIIKTKPGISIVSSVFFMCLDTKVLVYGDCAVNQNPDENELAQIALSSAQTAKAFEIQPRVAMLSYSTGESGSGEDVEKVKTATRIAKEMQSDLLIEGPIQYDAAIDCEVACLKLPESEVAGHANVFIFPDLNTGNNTYKAVQRSSGAIAIGPILQGLNKPINDLSRGCTVTDIINTVAITAIQAGQV